MSDLRLDDCAHCACVTHLSGYTPAQAVAGLEAGELGCANCGEADAAHGDRHAACVVLYQGGAALWDGRCRADPPPATGGVA